MVTPTEQLKYNVPLWAGVLFMALAVLSFALFFVRMPGQQLLPWLNLLLSGLTVVLFMAGSQRASSHPERYRGKRAGWLLTVFSSLLFLFAILAFHAARTVPDASSAPQVGQKAPEFELKDSDGQTMSLARLLAEPVNASPSGARPKAVLLVFYRGYW
jgi:hypothetical protein